MIILRLLKRVLGLLLVLLISGLMFNSVQAQEEITIKGKIIDSLTQAELFFANVSLLKEGTFVSGVQADPNGVFEIKVIEPKLHQLKVEYIGYRNKIIPLATVISTRQKVIDIGSIQLSAEALHLTEVEVKAKKPPLTMSGGNMTLNIAESILSNAGSALEVLQRAPGMSIDAFGNLNFRGSSNILVKIDGKETYVTGSDLSKFLQTLGSNSIDKIKIITSPSAKYEANGVAGIIEILTIKGKALGFNGTLKGTLGKGKKWRNNAGLDFNYRPQEGTNIYGSYSIFDEKVENLFDITRFINNENALTTFTRNSTETYSWITHNAKIGIDQQINSRHKIGGQYHAYLDYTEGLRELELEVSTAKNQDSLIIHRGSDERPWRQQSSNIYHHWTLDTSGTTIQTNVDYAYFNNENNADLLSDIFINQAVRANNRINNTQSKVSIASIKSDLNTTIASGSIAAGFKLSLVNTDNDYRSFKQDEDSDYILDPTLSNNFEFEERIYAAYLEYSPTIKGASLTLGVRTEFSDADGYSITLDSSFEQKIWGLFPNVNFSKQFDKHSINLAYSKRINRPGYKDVNPFQIYLDDYLFWRGNTNLTPQISHSLELTHGYKHFLYTTLSYGYISNNKVITNIQDNETGLLYKGPENFGNENYFGLTTSANFDIIKSFWFLSAQGGIYYTDLKDTRADVTNRGNIKGISYYYTSLHNSFSLPKQFSAELSYSFNRSPTSLWSGKSEGRFDLAFKKNFSNGANISLQLQDVLGPRTITNNYQYQNVDNRIIYVGDSRRVVLSFSYPFGKETVKRGQRRINNISEEKGRVGI